MRPCPFATRVFLTFVPMPFIGTMLHEAGHIVVARILGYSTHLRYGSMNWDAPDYSAITNADLHSNLISMGGPLINMGLGTVGLVALARLTKLGHTEFRGWKAVATVLALFWSRQLFNAALVVGNIICGEPWEHPDEVQIAVNLGWHPASILWSTAALAALAIVRTVWHLPKGQRIPFVLAGGSSSLVGYLVWYRFLGPLLLP
jgi:hypothetical protein